jgi:integrase
MPDGSATARTRRPRKSTAGKWPDWWSKRICQSTTGRGRFLCKRDRNAAGTVSIYTYKPGPQGKKGQTVPVGETGICAPEKVIDPAKRMRIELALNVFVGGNIEATVRELEGVTKVDMLVIDCLKLHSIAKSVFHEKVVEKIAALAAKAKVPEEAMNLRFQAERAKKAGEHEAGTLATLRAIFKSTWPNDDGPTVSQFEAPLQMMFVNKMREIGYADSVIDMNVSYIRAAMNHCDGEGRLLLKIPKRLGRQKWMIRTGQSKIVKACTLKEFAKLMDTAAEREDEWKYMNMETSGARANTIVELVWECVDLDPAAPRLMLNPPGKRITKKRRPVIALCPTLAAEMRTWTRDSYRIVTDGEGNPVNNGSALFIRIRNRAGLPYITAKMLRSFIRTWLMLMGVPSEIADAFIGHADDGSETGAFYKVQDPMYQHMCVVAIEQLYDAVRSLVRRPIAVPPKQKMLSVVESLLRAA